MVSFNTKIEDVSTKSDNYTQLHGHGEGACIHLTLPACPCVDQDGL